jgi:hypothetical protein
VCDFLVNNVSVVIVIVVSSSYFITRSDNVATGPSKEHFEITVWVGGTFESGSDGQRQRLGTGLVGCSFEHGRAVGGGFEHGQAVGGSFGRGRAVEGRSSAVAAVWGVLRARGQWVRVQARVVVGRVRGHM